MDKEGISKELVSQKLKNFKKEDMTYKSGRILGSMCTCPHEVGIEAYYMFLESNLGDSGLFKGTRQIEREVIAMLGSLLGKKDVCGHVITGGTEANLMAMRAARNSSGIKNPEIIIPKSAHFSFKKAADMLCLKIREAELDENYRIDIEHVKELIAPNTVAVVGIAGTTELGVIDSIEELSKICFEKDIYLHVDAAFGGFSIPFLKERRYNFPKFDFSLPGVSSITIDPHKMGLAPIPTGCILFRDRTYLKHISTETPYLTEKEQSTIVGTRTGASAAAAWALLKYFGKEGYAEIAEKCMDVTGILAEGVEKAGFQLIRRPELNLLAFKSEEMKTEKIADELEKKGWMVSISAYPKAIRIVVMPHIKEEHVKEFVEDLSEIRAKHIADTLHQDNEKKASLELTDKTAQGK
ncbi:tyrosine decarboxylase MfnA [Methanobacterium sp. ACI-7]|uniref:tyrosine decarboxylase MfnA n=1 Tax=unclassified Methanobacterium TaxID=2627676 RepID=UPI0039C047D4